MAHQFKWDSQIVNLFAILKLLHKKIEFIFVQECVVLGQHILELLAAHQPVSFDICLAEASDYVLPVELHLLFDEVKFIIDSVLLWKHVVWKLRV